MHILYVDESGDFGPLPPVVPPNSNHQPVVVILGLIVDEAKLRDLTADLLSLKSTFYPGLLKKARKNGCNRILVEIKGADVRRALLRGSPSEHRHAIGFMDKVVSLLEKHKVKIVGRVWVKVLGAPLSSTAIYTFSTQYLVGQFDQYLLTDPNQFGICIADSRLHNLNVEVAHSIFTQKFSAQLRHRRVAELPVFGHSDNHAGLQLCDLIASALLYPISCYVYLHRYMINVHVQANALKLRERYGSRLKAMQCLHSGSDGSSEGGIVVSDPVGHKPSGLMFSG